MAWQPIADDPSEALRKWAVITVVNEKGSHEEIDAFKRRVQEDPNYWLGWLIQNRKPNFPDLAAKVREIREGSLFVAPRHREMVDSIFDACNALLQATTTAEFTTAYYDNLELVKSKYRELTADVDRTLYPEESTHPIGPQ